MGTDIPELPETAPLTIGEEDEASFDHSLVNPGSCGDKMFSPRSFLFLLYLVSFLNYFDRGNVAGVLTEVELEFGLSLTQGGLIQGAFMAGYMTSSPIAGRLSSLIRPSYIIAIGMTSWGAGAVATSYASTHETFAISRFFVGIGGATFMCLAPPLIDDHAPPSSRARWLSYFYMASPLGTAAGYMVGGHLATYYHWRISFFIQSLVMMPFILIFCFIRIPQGAKRSRSPHSFTTAQSISMLMSNRVFVLALLGQSCYLFCCGGINFWTPHFLVHQMSLQLDYATFVFGLLSAGAGVLGTLSGGACLDHLNRVFGSRGNTHNKYTIPAVSLKLILLLVAIAMPALCFGFIADDHVTCLTLMGLGLFCLACVTAAFNTMLLCVVPTELRSFAMGLCIIFTHLLGDFPSPILVGMVSDYTHEQKLSMLLLPVWLFWALVFWAMAWSGAKARAEAIDNPEHKQLVSQ